MASNTSNDNAGSSSAANSSGDKGYSITSSGVNDQGNQYCKRDYGASAPNRNSYHYSNRDGSYYYNNANGSTYHNDGKGNSNYNPAK